MRAQEAGSFRRGQRRLRRAQDQTVAVGAQVPTVAIFGPTTKELGFFPYGAGHIVVERNMECRPCGLHGAKECPLGHFRCMKDISAEEVFAVLVQQVRKANLAAGVARS